MHRIKMMRSTVGDLHQAALLGGSWEGNVEVAEDFDGPDEMLVESFYNSSIFPDKQ